MDYLTNEEVKRAKMCTSNIQDKLQAIISELNNKHAYKTYLKEKMESITWDVKCMNSMLSEEGEENERS